MLLQLHRHVAAPPGRPRQLAAIKYRAKVPIPPRGVHSYLCRHNHCTGLAGDVIVESETVAQVHRSGALRAGDLGRRSLLENLTVSDDVRPVANLERVADVVVGD